MGLGIGGTGSGTHKHAEGRLLACMGEVALRCAYGDGLAAVGAAFISPST